METMTSGWTDERLDDLKEQVVELDRRMEQRFVGLERHMEQWFGGLERRMESGFRELHEEMTGFQRETNARFDSLQRTMIQFGGVMIAALVGLFATQLGLILTQL
jgi:hypothetical protein